MFAVQVDSVVCPPNSDGDIVAIPNADGNACICEIGYARVDGVCTSCQPGSQPRVDRERGCEQCLYYPGTVSGDGSACVACAVGLKPMSDFTACIPCQANTYYDLLSGTCLACTAGMELNPDVAATDPCVQCNPQSAGLTGTCTVCESGKQPREDTTPPRTQCEVCPAGFAGLDGVCTLCPAGKHADSRGQSCEICLPGRYRDAELVSTCVKCPEGMTSDAQSVTEADCRCPKNEYDVLNVDGNVAPIFCWPTGVEGSFKTIDENKISLSDWQGVEFSVAEGTTVQRCMKCPGCVSCDFEYKGVDEKGEPAKREPPWPEDYRGKPYTQVGWAVYDPIGVPATLEPGVSALALTRGGMVDNPGVEGEILARNVFACPFNTVCQDELEYRNFTKDHRLCTVGYLLRGI